MKKDAQKKDKKSKKLLDRLQTKWLKAAIDMGGANAKLVLAKPKVKILIFDLLHNSFKPFTTNDIHRELKAVVPSPILGVCLNEMVLQSNPSIYRGENDEEDESALNVKASQDRFIGSLLRKYGRNINNTLFYVNQITLVNNGNGFRADQCSKLMTLYESTDNQLSSLRNHNQQLRARTIQLNSELTNEDLQRNISSLEMETLKIFREIEDAKVFAENEKKKIILMKSRKFFLSCWKKRKIICKDFLLKMEEWSEGIIIAKKCLKGNGPIEIDSDDSFIERAAYERKTSYDDERVKKRRK